MKVVYVAGPFRANNPQGTPDMWRVQQNIMRAMNLALAVWQSGAVALCPHANCMFFTGAGDDPMWLAGAMELMRRCDAVVLVEGWENSAGTLLEVAHARERGLPVFETMAECAHWVEAKREH